MYYITRSFSKSTLNRALKFIEAISKDLTTQLLKVWSTQRVMIISFYDFEKTMKSCFETSYKQLQDFKLVAMQK